MAINNTAIITQIHPDVTNYYNRVRRAGGNIRSLVISAINEFVKWHYLTGLRSNTGINHTITFCHIAATMSITGSYEKLWFPSGNSPTLGFRGNPTYSEDVGFTVKGNTNYLISDVNANTFFFNNLSLFFYNNSITNSPNKDFIGNFNGNDNLLIVPRWTDNRIYFDIGTTALGRINGNSNNDVKGLYLGSKQNNIQYISIRGSIVGQSNNASTSGLNLPNAILNFPFARDADSSATANRNLCGFGFGLSISQSILPELNTRWINLQRAISINRI